MHDRRAEMERNLTQERTRSAMAVKRANGKRIGTVPYGYDLTGNDSTLAANEAGQAVIANIQAMRLSGMKLHRRPGSMVHACVTMLAGSTSAG